MNRPFLTKCPIRNGANALKIVTSALPSERENLIPRVLSSPSSCFYEGSDKHGFSA